jgi:5-methylcytosine-specific restriction enzyme subunit McrC
VTTLLLREYETTEITLDADTAAALAATGSVVVTPVPGVARWCVGAGHHVGVVSVGDTTVFIRPKMPVARLIFLLGYATDPKAWRDDPAHVGDDDELWGAMAQVFVRQAEQALAQGVLQGYRVEDATLHVLRGRLRENDQMRLRPGLPTPIEVRFDEYDVDIAENRLLRAATERLLRLPRVAPAASRRLRHLRARLADVRHLVPGEPLPPTPSSRLNARYGPALAIARLVLRSRSVDVASGGSRATGLLFDMNNVFEDFVTVALTEALSAYGGRCRAQDPHWLDTANRLPLYPDLVWYAGSRPAAVVDAKYKSGTAKSFPPDDLYQLLAYCTALALPRGHLVYAEGPAPAAQYVVRPGGPTLVRHSLDLTIPVPSLLARMRDIAGQVRAPIGAAARVTA